MREFRPPARARRRRRLLLPFRCDRPRVRGSLDPHAGPGVRPHGLRGDDRAHRVHGRPRSGQLGVRTPRRPPGAAAASVRPARDRRRRLLSARAGAAAGGRARVPGPGAQRVAVLPRLQPRPVRAGAGPAAAAHHAHGRHTAGAEPPVRHRARHARPPRGVALRAQHVRRGGGHRARGLRAAPRARHAGDAHAGRAREPRGRRPDRPRRSASRRAGGSGGGIRGDPASRGEYRRRRGG